MNKSIIITIAVVAVITAALIITHPSIIVDFGNGIVFHTPDIQIGSEPITDMDIVNAGGEY